MAAEIAREDLDVALARLGPLLAAHVQQAHEGRDFDFLLGMEALPEPWIHRMGRPKLSS